MKGIEEFCKDYQIKGLARQAVRSIYNRCERSGKTLKYCEYTLWMKREIKSLVSRHLVHVDPVEQYVMILCNRYCSGFGIYRS